MKKRVFLVLGISFSLVVGCCLKVDKEEPFSPWLQNTIKKYRSLEKRKVDSENFLDELIISDTSCMKLWNAHQWFTTYPSDIPESVPSDSVPNFEEKPFDHEQTRRFLKPIIDSLYLNENYPDEFRMESVYPISRHNGQKEQKQKIQLKPFIKESTQSYGLLSEPIDELAGARLELVYYLHNIEKKQILLDENIPLTYEISVINDSVKHSFSFGLKDRPFTDIKIGYVEMNLLPPSQQYYLRLTQDSIGKIVYFNDIPMILSAFENGVMHLIVSNC